ncbi:MAG TPA: addiction module protein [Longimicrobium sp.]|nr:addiction module protein [Longimicrobium sp.]
MSMTVEELEAELRNQPEEVRDYLANMLIETLDDADVDEDAVETEAHRRYLELESGEAEGVDGDEVIAQLRARRRR